MSKPLSTKNILSVLVIVLCLFFTYKVIDYGTNELILIIVLDIIFIPMALWIIRKNL